MGEEEAMHSIEEDVQVAALEVSANKPNFSRPKIVTLPVKGFTSTRESRNQIPAQIFQSISHIPRSA